MDSKPAKKRSAKKGNRQEPTVSVHALEPVVVVQGKPPALTRRPVIVGTLLLVLSNVVLILSAIKEILAVLVEKVVFFDLLAYAGVPFFIGMFIGYVLLLGWLVDKFLIPRLEQSSDSSMLARLPRKRLRRITKYGGATLLVTLNFVLLSGPPTNIDHYNGEVRRSLPKWTATLLDAQNPKSHGIGTSIEVPGAKTQVWTTAQALTAVLVARKTDLKVQKEIDDRAESIRQAFGYIESLRSKDGWTYWPKGAHTVTEVAAWVTLARLLALEARIWTGADAQAQAANVKRDVLGLIGRQDPETGGFRPVAQTKETRTYTTMMSLWALIEAVKAQAQNRLWMKPAELTKCTGSLRQAILWLMRTHNEKLGWLPNPARIVTMETFPGLTAQILFVLSECQNCSIENIRSTVTNHETYARAQQQLLKVLDSRESGSRIMLYKSIFLNERTPDDDVHFDDLPKFRLEGSTFLWFPWSLAAVYRIGKKDGATENIRQHAQSVLRGLLPRFRVNEVLKFVDLKGTATYVLAETLLCSSHVLQGHAEEPE